MSAHVEINTGDCLTVLKLYPDKWVNCCVTSPPYWGLRDYGVEGQIGLEPTPEEYVEKLVRVFREVRRVLRDDGTLWLNLGDSYSAHPGQRKGTDKAGSKQQSKRGSTGSPSHSVGGLKPKDLIGIPWRVAFALQEDGWYLRQDIIWHKPNPMPESVTDRCTKSHEYIFLLSKSGRYFYDADAIREPHKAESITRAKRNSHPNELRAIAFPGGNPSVRDRGEGTIQLAANGRNKRSVWTVPTKPYKGAHFATFPPALIEPCILAGCPVGGTVLDPFGGSGTTGMVAKQNNRHAILIELNQKYVDLQHNRVAI